MILSITGVRPSGAGDASTGQNWLLSMIGSTGDDGRKECACGKHVADSEELQIHMVKKYCDSL